MGGDAIKGHVDLLLLAVVEEGEAHGYALIQRLKQRSDEVIHLPEGTIYPALHRLETGGMLKSRWDERDGRRRRVYTLTGKGRTALDRERAARTSLSGAINAVVVA
jgi:DNA-binding PadR family transcriptional regulator